MAVSLSSFDSIEVVKRHLDPSSRYRCLLLQSKDIALLSQFTHHVRNAHELFGTAIREMDALQQFDDVGAFSCDSILKHITAVAFDYPLLISGPLTFLDYWSPNVRGIFWQFLSTFSNGPGIVVTDVYRTDTVFGPFQLVESFSRTDFRCLKTRLEYTQDRLA